MASVFRRVTKYLPGEVDQHENRLTEVFAAVLTEVPALPHALVQRWAGDAHISAGPVWIRTQRSTAHGNFVDLELCFGAPVAPDLRVWVEIKHGAPLHENQLQNYVEDLRSLPQNESRLILLAPRDSMPEDKGIADAAVAWQDVARWLVPLTRAEQLEPEHRWLVKQLLTYLGEERLVDEERLSATHAVELAVRPSAERAVSRLTEQAETIVTKEWGTADRVAGGQTPKFGPGWWAAFEPRPVGNVGWTKTWFEWSLKGDDGIAEPRDSFAFLAGVTFENKKDTVLSSPAAGAWLAARTADKFEHFEQYYWRLQRVLYPEQLLARETLAAQAQELADWVIDAFHALEANPPAT